MPDLCQTKTIFSQEQLLEICRRATERMSDIFSALDISLIRDGKKYYGPCPIHGGDKFNAFNIYHEGDLGNWKCRTQLCHKTFAQNIIGFVRGVLSRQKYDWECQGDEEASFVETIDFILACINLDPNNIKVVQGQTDTKRFVNFTKQLKEGETKTESGMVRQEVRYRLDIPAKYYMHKKPRNYTPQILDKYDIGLCLKPTSPMYKRVVVPVYDQDHMIMVGCTGRSIFDKCPQCGSWHNPNNKCPIGGKEKGKFPKWKHSFGFKAHQHLYNLWFAKACIKSTGVAIITESPGNIWRLEEAGINNAVAIFGTDLHISQQMLLNKTGAVTLIIIMDNDINEAGQKAAERIRNKCERIYNIEIVTIPPGDLGDMLIEDIEEIIKPQIKKFELKV